MVPCAARMMFVSNQAQPGDWPLLKVRSCFGDEDILSRDALASARGAPCPRVAPHNSIKVG